ncbi:glycan-binding surface protein [Dysgonomonas sp. 511]|uniref:glycan-binding surface protein n=1 Tax=Dysgonomonas sp. 511 TaxID=2302930 RepID=UPI0013D6BEFC|nr:glycan-binding surface protein [Dysgonomonas sp. 511]NDV77397.1 hypothetical protein [Dysgonomonas sp. 511]
MKKYIFNIIIILSAFAAFTSCSDDDDNGGSGKTPVVRYVRPTDATKSDSLLDKAYLGSQIAIIGENLSKVNKIYFNDQKAKLNPNFVTDNAIIVTIPAGIPGEKEDLIKLYTNNDSCYYTFETLVPAPSPRSMTYEYVADGELAYIQGLYFIHEDANPLTVVFPGNLEAEVVSHDINNLVVRVPSGAQSGPLKVTSVYGTGESYFDFRDQRNIILDFDTRYPDGEFWHGWHGGTGYGTEGGANGQYLILAGEVTVSAEGNTSTSDPLFCYDRWTYRQTDPDFFDAGNLENYALKFEVNVQNWSAGALQVIFTGASESWMNWQETSNGGNPNENAKWSESYPRAMWMPWTETGEYSTEGWITVTIPMTDVKYGMNGATVNTNSSGHYSGVTLFVGGSAAIGTTCNPTFHIDNVRVVKAQR